MKRLDLNDAGRRRRNSPVYLVEPLLHVVEGLHVRHVVHDNDAVRASVVAARNRAEALLASRIPLERGLRE